MSSKYRYPDQTPGLTDRLAVLGWEARPIGMGIWGLIPSPIRYMTMTGSAVTLNAAVPIAHRLVRFEWKHTNSSQADAAGATAAILGTMDSATNLQTIIYAEAASTSANTVVPFGEGYEDYFTTYVLSFNTSNTDLIYPMLVIQELRGK